MTTPVLTKDGKRLAAALAKAEMFDEQTVRMPMFVLPLNTAAASLRLPLEGDASLREADKKRLSNAIDSAINNLRFHHQDATADELSVAACNYFNAALARPQPEAKGPVAAGVASLENIARILDPASWEQMDYLVGCAEQGTGASRLQQHYARAYQSGARSGEDMRKWCMETDQGYPGYGLRSSLHYASKVFALFSTTPPAEAKTPDAGVGLWCMHVAGPDDIHAAPDFWTALAWAAELNGFIAKRAIAGKWAEDDNWPLTQATVQPWPGTAEDHGWRLAKELADRAAHEARRAALTPTGSAGEDDTGVREALAKVTAERDAYKNRGDNHAETLRGVRRWIRSGDIDRALLWISDGLTGYAEPAATYLAEEIVRREAAEAALAAALAPQPPKAETPAGVGDEQTTERAMMRIEAEADAWVAETPDIGKMVGMVAHGWPPHLRGRAAAQADALVRQTFVEAFYRGFNAHKDHAAALSAAPGIRSGGDPDCPHCGLAGDLVKGNNCGHPGDGCLLHDAALSAAPAARPGDEVAGWLPVEQFPPRTKALFGRWEMYGAAGQSDEEWNWEEATGTYYDYDGERFWNLDGRNFSGSPFYGKAPTHAWALPAAPADRPVPATAPAADGGRA